MRSVALCLVILALAASSGCSGGCSGNANTGRGNNTAPDNGKTDGPACGLHLETVVLEDLPELDPRYLWPSNNARSAAETCWISWKTTTHSMSRLLLSSDGKHWKEYGQSVAKVHDRKVDLGQWHSQVMFCVEFEENEVRCRSRARMLSFGRGAHWSEPEARVNVERKPDQRYELRLEGADPALLPTSAYVFALAPDDLKIGCAPVPGDATGGMVVLIVDGATVPENGVVCYLQVYDGRSDTYDRVKLIVTAK